MVGLQLPIIEQEKKKKLVDNLKLQNFPAFSNTEDARKYYYRIGGIEMVKRLKEIINELLKTKTKTSKYLIVFDYGVLKDKQTKKEIDYLFNKVHKKGIWYQPEHLNNDKILVFKKGE